jgi:hypothetical protein
VSELQVSTWIRYGGQLVAVVDDHSVWLADRIQVLELDHPVRRFVAMKCLVAREMQTGAGTEPYDDARADCSVRSALIPDDEFDALTDRLPDAALAEHFNVPLDAIDAKRYDRAYLRHVVTGEPSSARLWNREARRRTGRLVSRPRWRAFGWLF